MTKRGGEHWAYVTFNPSATRKSWAAASTPGAMPDLLVPAHQRLPVLMQSGCRGFHWPVQQVLGPGKERDNPSPSHEEPRAQNVACWQWDTGWRTRPIFHRLWPPPPSRASHKSPRATIIATVPQVRLRVDLGEIWATIIAGLAESTGSSCLVSAPHPGRNEVEFPQTNALTISMYGG